MFKHILALVIIVSFSYAQNNWLGGNLSKINEISIDVSVNGLEDPMWEKKVMQVSLLFLERFKLKINPDRFSPSIDIRISVIEPGDNPLVSYNIDLSVYDFFVSKDDYTKNYSKKKIIKKFKIGKIYQQNVLGQSSNELMRADMENTLIRLLDSFIDQWYRDNPLKQF
ncbi:MAG: hypothetical protein VYC61_04155 [Candidatus Neomarinimicrobiota bacterium]|jgi:hypothetical protein|nr:hypothetical protein [Candidatus Neomarinimicrobiota bacterium]|tara:strand:+ start:259 stop:762 length:504 start_codon:yes stop_codon:yes gene_type:complete